MVMISGSSVQNFTGCSDFQELDQIAAVKHFSKFSTKATDITKKATFVFAAIDWTATGSKYGTPRCDGTYLGLPTDVLHQTINKSEAENLIT
ncbi:hypothetical protein ACP275_07G078800 [Erythranthe tilingii]